MTSPTSTLYETIGGVDAVRAAVDDFYVTVLADPRLAHYFEGVDVNRVKAHQVRLFTGLLGGPEAYEGMGLAAAHQPLHIPPDDYELVVGHLVATLQKFAVGDEVIAAFGAAATAVRPDIVDQGLVQADGGH
ncbi:group 1 truncated hemoglobin [Spongisporangium articulatum]|uniref:Group 1 truncated hemoglobin n=1 Tax=Spongisporangium articulatum TaxID=3362603 RepID=A0ABW8AN44_9ACTN